MEYTYHVYYAANWLILPEALEQEPYPFYDFLDSSIDFEVDLKWQTVTREGYIYIRFIVRSDSPELFDNYAKYSKFLGIAISDWAKTTRSEYVSFGFMSERNKRISPYWGAFEPHWGEQLLKAGIQNKRKQKQQSN